MPFKISTVMEEKLEFVQQAVKQKVKFSELCRRFGISRPTGYKWLHRYQKYGEEGLKESSRRPKAQPRATSVKVVEAVVKMKKREPHWGAKKLRVLLEREGVLASSDLPSERTINRILRRNDLSVKQPKTSKAVGRYEYAKSNELWQMDFKGHFALADGTRCYPLTITDDHSRFNIMLEGCANQRIETVKPLLIKAFKKYGLPEAILCDNSAPWGSTKPKDPNRRVITQLEAWLIRLNVRMIHGRPRHPQTQGKCERFHRTLKHEAIEFIRYKSLSHSNERFKSWSYKYNHYRPHEALGMAVPADKYEVSPRSYPKILPEPTYGKSDIVVKVDQKGNIYFKGQQFYIGEGLQRQSVAIRYGDAKDTFEVFYCNQEVMKLTLKV